MTRNEGQTIQFACPQCLSWWRTPADLAGRRWRCPRCQCVFKVPPKTQALKQGEVYSLNEGVEPPPIQPTHFISVICRACNTRMHATVEQIGQTLTCPDCGATAVVPPPIAPPRAVEPPPVIAEVYGVHEYTLADDSPTIEDAQIRVICNRCGTLMYVTKEQTGTEIICPDCQMPAIVPPPVQTRPKFRSPEEIGEYSLAKPVATEPNATGTPRVPSARDDDEDDDDEDTSPEDKQAERARQREARDAAAWQASGQMPPAKLFLENTFAFPLTASALGPILALVAGLALISAALAGSMRGGSIDPGGGMFNAGPWVGRMLFAMIGLTMLAGWLVAASGYGLTILRDTAYGADTIENWPNPLALEGVVELVYVVFGLIFAGLPGVLVGRFWPELEIAQQTAVYVSQIVFFPIALLSMLEANSPLKPVSWPIWRSVFHAWRAWMLFYVLTAAMFLTAVVLPTAASLQVDSILGMVLSAVVVGPVWFIYFRLLGRLAWFSSGQAEKS
jgi:hypothetical protein